MQVFKVTGMACAHCQRAVIQAVHALDPAAKVLVDLAEGRVQVDSTLDEQQILDAIAEEGYRVE